MPELMADLFPLSHHQVSKKKHTFEIQLDNGQKIVASAFKDLVSVKVEGGTVESFGDSVGMLGTYGNGTMLARDGVTVLEDPIAFGLEWQVQGDEPLLFQTRRYPQHPQTCTPPNSPESIKSRTRRLGEALVTEAAARKACHHWQEDHRELCVYDVLALSDLELAEAGSF